MISSMSDDNASFVRSSVLQRALHARQQCNKERSTGPEKNYKFRFSCQSHFFTSKIYFCFKITQKRYLIPQKISPVFLPP